MLLADNMLQIKAPPADDLNPQETAEWVQAFDQILDEAGPDRASFLLSRLAGRARAAGAAPQYAVNTPYVNTIPVEEQVPFPGDRALERRLKSLIRWNALAMVVRANKYDPGIGGHISSYASLATLVEVGFNHFFRGSYGDQPGDLVYLQGHSAPGYYARAYLEGRLNDEHLRNFRHELREHPGLSSYPHPWLMPDFWQFPTVSMGLGPINAIYQARFMRYLENRGLLKPTPRKVWAFLGDGETDEPESTGAIRIAANEKLDNLIFVINCNLQRLDGPVRGNGKIIQELEAIFAGAKWNVIKVIWGSDWDELLARDQTGLLQKRMNECLDGDYQTFVTRGGAYIRKEFFGKYPELLDLVAHFTDDQLARLRRGGHDPEKVYNAYKRAVEYEGGPTVILAKTIKGYGLGEAGEGRNVTHQQKKLNEQEMEYFCKRFEIPITPEKIHEVAFYRPPEDAPEMRYMHERRAELGGYLPERKPKRIEMEAPPLDYFSETLTGSAGREVSTTMAFVRAMTLLLRHPKIGHYVVPIIPDEARTFGMESLFRQIGIYASQGQLYHPVDQEMFLYYREVKDGQILEEGITEAGAMASFTAAGTSYGNFGLPMIPLYTYYSMFGLQRMGDLLWAFGDSRGKGFIVGRDGRPHHAQRRGPAAPGRPQPPADERAANVRGLRSGLRLRDRRHLAGRLAAHVPGERRHLLLHDRLQRKLCPAAHAGGRGGGHPQGDLPLQGGGGRPGGRAAFRQRPDAERGRQGPADAGGEVRNRGRGLERDQLQRAAARGAGGGSLEPFASGGAGTAAVHPAGARGHPGAHNRLVGLHEGGCRPDRALARRPAGGAGNRRLWPQRESRAPARFLRGQRETHRCRHAFAPGPRRQVRRRARRRGAGRVGRQPGAPGPGEALA